MKMVIQGIKALEVVYMIVWKDVCVGLISVFDCSDCLVYLSLFQFGFVYFLFLFTSL
jgi:hypothetical protein